MSQDTVKGSLNFIRKVSFTGKDLRYNFENVKNDKPDSGYENSVLGAGIGFRMRGLKTYILHPA